jgi:hypothetical protein
MGAAVQVSGIQDFRLAVALLAVASIWAITVSVETVRSFVFPGERSAAEEEAPIERGPIHYVGDGWWGVDTYTTDPYETIWVGPAEAEELRESGLYEFGEAPYEPDEVRERRERWQAQQEEWEFERLPYVLRTALLELSGDAANWGNRAEWSRRIAEWRNEAILRTPDGSHQRRRLERLAEPPLLTRERWSKQLAAYVARLNGDWWSRD